MIGHYHKNKIKYGPARYRRVFFDNWVQQRLSRSRDKMLTNQYGDKSLEGLEIDWHLANTERMFDVFVEPVMDSQPTYAYVA